MSRPIVTINGCPPPGYEHVQVLVVSPTTGWPPPRVETRLRPKPKPKE